MRREGKENLSNVFGAAGVVLQVILVFAVFIVLCTLGACAAKQLTPHKSASVSESVNEVWGLDPPIPENLQIYTENTLGWDGFGVRFSAVSFESEPSEFILSFHAEENVDFEMAFSDTIGRLSEKKQIPSGLFPDWEETYFWRYAWKTEDGSQSGDDFPAEWQLFLECLYMAYFPASQTLFICEDLF